MISARSFFGSFIYFLIYLFKLETRKWPTQSTKIRTYKLYLIIPWRQRIYGLRLLPTINENKAALDLVSYIPGVSPLSKLLAVLLCPPDPAHHLKCTDCSAVSRHSLLRHNARQRGEATRHHDCLTGSVITRGEETMGCENFRLKHRRISKKVRQNLQVFWIRWQYFEVNSWYKSWQSSDLRKEPMAI